MDLFFFQARIKAKPLIRNYPRNGYINKRFQPPPPVTAQLPTEVVTSSAPQPQFTATQPFTLMPNVLQYLNSQQVSYMFIAILNLLKYVFLLDCKQFLRKKGGKK